MPFARAPTGVLRSSLDDSCLVGLVGRAGKPASGDLELPMFVKTGLGRTPPRQRVRMRVGARGSLGRKLNE